MDTSVLFSLSPIEKNGAVGCEIPTDGVLSECLIPRFTPLIGGELNLLYFSFGSQF